ncbi:MAG: glycoside hydrolase family 2 TIM barrel-domain containing protein, partial [Endomicrobiales bacterium]
MRNISDQERFNVKSSVFAPAPSLFRPAHGRPPSGLPRLLPRFFRPFPYLRLFLLWCLALLLVPAESFAARVTKQGRQLLVDGQPFTIKGVCYSPVPVGSNWSYPWGDNSLIYEADMRLIKAMGANTVRTYQERNITQGFLDAAQRNGLYVIVGWTEELWDKDFSTPAARTAYLDHFEAFVNTWKAHPAVLMWCFGNEIEEHTLSGKPNWYLLLNQAA